MSIFDLLFIGIFLATVIYGAGMGWLAVQRRWGALRRRALWLGSALCVYLLVVITVGVLSPTRVLPTRDMLRYDDWRLGIESASWTEAIGSAAPSQADRRFLIVTLRIQSTARRVSQAAPAGALIYVVDGRGGRFDVADRGQAAFERLHGAQPELTVKLEPGGSFQTTRIFEVPRAPAELYLCHRHGSGARFPGMFIIGEGFRPAPMIRLGV